MHRALIPVLVLLLTLLSEETAAQRRVFNVAVVPVQFQDVSFAEGVSEKDVQDLFTGIGVFDPEVPGSVSDYFNDNLGGEFQFNFFTAPIVTLSRELAWYGRNSNTAIDIHSFEMFREVLTLLEEAKVELPFGNGARVDCVFLLNASEPEADGSNPDFIWPHTTDVSGLGITLRKMPVGYYSCASFLKSDGSGERTGIGPVCHELCHALGLMDMYDANGEVEGLAEGLWSTLSIMDRGAFNNGGVTPPLLNAVEREMLGAVNVEDLEPYQSYFLSPLSISRTVYRIPTDNPDEYFLLECRRPAEWDRFIGGEGLVVYHIDRSSARAGSMSAAQRWDFNAVNCCSSHQCADIIESSGAAATAAEDVFFPGPMNVTELNSASPVPLLCWSGNGPDICLKNISYTLGIVRFETDVDVRWKFPVVEECREEPFQTECRIEWRIETEKRGNWTFSWWEEGREGEARSLEDCGTAVSLENLRPDCVYGYSLIFNAGDLSREVYRSVFATLGVSSEFPLIWMPAGTFKTGESLDLKVFNIPGDCSSILWNIDGRKVTDSKYTFKTPGKHSIAVTLDYFDGTQETVERIVTVGGTR